MEQDKGYLMLPRGVQHMRALGRFGRFTLFSPPVSPSNDTCSGSLVLVFGLFGLGFLFVLSRFCFLFCKCNGISQILRLDR